MQVILHLVDEAGLLLLVVDSRIEKVSLSDWRFSARKSLPDMRNFTFAQMQKVSIEILLSCGRGKGGNRVAADPGERDID